MAGGATLDFSELAYHLIWISDFWRRWEGVSTGRGIRVIEEMIEIYVGKERAGKVARAVVLELDSLRVSRVGEDLDPASIEVVFVASFLAELVREPERSARESYWSEHFASLPSPLSEAG